MRRDAPSRSPPRLRTAHGSEEGAHPSWRGRRRSPGGAPSDCPCCPKRRGRRESRRVRSARRVASPTRRADPEAVRRSGCRQEGCDRRDRSRRRLSEVRRRRSALPRRCPRVSSLGRGRCGQFRESRSPAPRRSVAGSGSSAHRCIRAPGRARTHRSPRKWSRRKVSLRSERSSFGSCFFRARTTASTA